MNEGGVDAVAGVVAETITNEGDQLLVDQLGLDLSA